MTEQNPDFIQPPWVQSPSEVRNWIDATHPSGTNKGGRHGAPSEEMLWNLHVFLDLNVEHKTIPPSTILSKLRTILMGNGFVEEGFDLVPTTELVLRGLAKAKFKQLVKIRVDKKIVFKHSDENSTLRKSIDDFNWLPPDSHAKKSLEVTAAAKETMSSIATVKIMKIHREKDHAITIEIKGGIKKGLYHSFRNYLTESLDVKTE